MKQDLMCKYLYFAYFCPSCFVNFSGVKGAGGGLRPAKVEIKFSVIFTGESVRYQMLFTGSKNNDPSRSYKILKSGKYE